MVKHYKAIMRGRGSGYQWEMTLEDGSNGEVIDYNPETGILLYTALPYYSVSVEGRRARLCKEIVVARVNGYSTVGDIEFELNDLLRTPASKRNRDIPYEGVATLEEKMNALVYGEEEAWEKDDGEKDD